MEKAPEVGAGLLPDGERGGIPTDVGNGAQLNRWR